MVRGMPWIDDPMHERDPLVQLGWVIVGAMVKRRRTQLRWSQRELAKRCSLTQPIISRLENGQLRGLKMHRLAAIVAVMGGLDVAAPHPPFRAVHPEAFEPYRLDYAPPDSDIHQWLPNRNGGSYTSRDHGRSSLEWQRGKRSWEGTDD
jgi:transcriptional regulator with XRE-family HTH domain